MSIGRLGISTQSQRSSSLQSEKWHYVVQPVCLNLPQVNSQVAPLWVSANAWAILIIRSCVNKKEEVYLDTRTFDCMYKTVDPHQSSWDFTLRFFESEPEACPAHCHGGEMALCFIQPPHTWNVGQKCMILIVLVALRPLNKFWAHTQWSRSDLCTEHANQSHALIKGYSAQ